MKALVLLVILSASVAWSDNIPAILLFSCKDNGGSSPRVSIKANLQRSTGGVHCVVAPDGRCNMSGIASFEIGAPYNVTSRLSVPLIAHYVDRVVYIQTFINILGSDDTRAPLVKAILRVVLNENSGRLTIPPDDKVPPLTCQVQDEQR